jgi:hypothetical protein
MRLMPRPLADGSFFIYIPLPPGSVTSTVKVATASQLPIPEVVLRSKIERGFFSLFSPQKGRKEQAWDCG